MERQPYFQTMEKFLVHETAIHIIDVFRFLLAEEPSTVYAALRRLNPAICACNRLSFSSLFAPISTACLHLLVVFCPFSLHFLFVLWWPFGLVGPFWFVAGEDAGYMLFDFPSGARAIFDGNRLADHKAGRVFYLHFF